MCQKWFVKFHAGDFSLNNAPQLGRPLEVDSNQVKMFIEKINVIPHWRQLTYLKYQINKVFGETEKHVFHFMEKMKWTFWPTQ